MKDILKFQDEHRWLSNFWPACVKLDGVQYFSVENAYQAAKVPPHIREPFTKCSASEAKSLGRTVKIQYDWENEKIAVMEELIKQKFSAGSELGDRLLATGNCQIVEGNHWGDTFWGICRGKGTNHLGRLIMEQRARLQGTPSESGGNES